MAYTEGTITTKDVYTVSGMVDEDALLEIGEVLSTTDTAAAFELADRLMREGRDVRELLRSASNHFRDVLELKVGADRRHSDDQRWRDQADAFDQQRLVSIIDIFAAAEKDLQLERAAPPRAGNGVSEGDGPSQRDGGGRGARQGALTVRPVPTAGSRAVARSEAGRGTRSDASACRREAQRA